MKIETAEFGLTKKEMLQLLAANYLKRKWWILLLLAAVLPWAWQMMGRPSLELALVAVAVFLVWVPAELLRHVFLPRNKRLYLKRRHEFDDEWIFTRACDDSIGKAKWSSVTAVSRTGNHFLIYVSKKQFLVVPRSAFRTDGDLRDFEEFLARRRMG